MDVQARPRLVGTEQKGVKLGLSRSHTERGGDLGPLPSLAHDFVWSEMSFAAASDCPLVRTTFLVHRQFVDK